MSRIRVLIVDDHEIVRDGLRAVLEQEADIELVGEASDGEAAVALARTLTPEVVLMDLSMPRLDGIAALTRIRKERPQCQVVVLTNYAGDQRVRDALGAGAIGYLLKDVMRRDLVEAIRRAREGRPFLHPEAQRMLMHRVTHPPAPHPSDQLTPRERSVLELIARGQSNKEIASSLGLTEGTVKGYVSAVLAKIGVGDRTQAALYAVQHGIAPLGPSGRTDPR
ncbi:MAG TPA: response regulator transcription factor [Vicinamibacteria bacterium]|nr:response regulator transcription factor [Vicinamibacteria bacterium]